MDRRGTWHLVQDVGLAALVGGLALAEIWVPFDSVQGTGSPVVTTAGIVIETVLIALRRRWPIGLVGVPLLWVGAAVIVGPTVQVVFFGQLVAVCVALYSVARHGSRREIGLVAGATAGMLLLGDLFLPPLQVPSEILFDWLVAVIVFGAGLGLRASERRAVAAAVRATRVEAAAREASLRAIADERARIARELHDILGHSVSVMVVQAGAAAQAVVDDPAFVRRALEAIRTAGTASLDEVRRVVALLRADDAGALAPQPGLAQLPDLVEQARTDGLDIRFVQLGGGPPLTAGQELTVYRIVQEALTNVRKHAGAGHAQVELRQDTDGIDVTVTDDGSGPVVRGEGHGLLGMRERVAVYGGTFGAGPVEDGPGWRVRASLPAGPSR